MEFFLPGVFFFSASVTFGFGGNGPASVSEYGASSFNFSFLFNEAVTELGMGEVRSERNPVNLTLFRDICGVGCCEVFPV